MASQTSQDTKKSKPVRTSKNAQTTPKSIQTKTKKVTDTSKIVKSLIFGPTIAILGTTVLYFAWWGISKAFMILHGIVTAKFIPWVGTNWPIFVGVWALVVLTSIVYSTYMQYQEKTKKDKVKENTQNENPVQKTNTENKKGNPVQQPSAENQNVISQQKLAEPKTRQVHRQHYFSMEDEIPDLISAGKK